MNTVELTYLTRCVGEMHQGVKDVHSDTRLTRCVGQLHQGVTGVTDVQVTLTRLGELGSCIKV